MLFCCESDLSRAASLLLQCVLQHIYELVKIIATLKSFENMPVIDCAVNMDVKEGDIMSAASSNNLFGFPSRPVDYVCNAMQMQNFI